MSKRITDEERVVMYFNNAPADAVTVVFNIVRGIVRNRGIGGRKATTATRVNSRKRTNSNTSVAVDEAVAQ